ncbi:MAG: helical backbone metal receptor [Gammaproteobacteria bacterium]|nr:helical backbone metal receptor [Gammaproteobacteria bacterium]
MNPTEWVDDIGTAHPPAEGNARIVSLVPSITELLFALDLGDRLVGRTTFCVHPADGVAKVARVGGTKTVSLEKVERARPTHVIVNVDENRKEDVDSIAAMGCRVVVTHPIEPEDNLRLYRLLGGLFDRSDRAETLCRDFSHALDELRAAAASFRTRRVLYLIWRDPWMTISEDTYISRTLALARLQTVGGDPDVRYPEIEFEDGLMDQVDHVLLSTEPFPFKAKHLDEVRELTRRWQVPARIIDAEMVSWYGPRAIPGLRYLRDFAAALD